MASTAPVTHYVGKKKGGLKGIKKPDYSKVGTLIRG